jgi:membrane-associated protein
VVAGVAGMSYRKFASYNVIGGVAWVLSMTFIGYVLGVRFPLLVAHIEKVIIVVVLLSVAPALVEWARAKRRARAASESETHRAA